MKHIIQILLLLLPVGVPAQVTIQGRAPAYAGKEIMLVMADDCLSGKNRVLASAKVSDSGKFTINSALDKTAKCWLVCNNSRAIVYTDPGATYSLEFPAPDEKDKYQPVKFVYVLFDTLNTDDINNLVLDFNSRADEFVYYNFNILASDIFSQRIDTFKLYCSRVYKDVHHDYFLDYVAYSVGEIEMMGPIRMDKPRHEAYIYETYFNNRQVGYHHDKYIDFFNKFYEGSLKNLGPAIEKPIRNAINFYASPKQLDRLLAKDEMLHDKRIRELVMMKSLKEEYYSRDYLSDQIMIMLDSISRFSEFDEHKRIATNIVEELSWLAVGTAAPDFTVPDFKDQSWKLADHKGKYLYMGFWSTDNTHSINEMKLLLQMYRKYSRDVDVVMVNMDENPAAWKEFLKKHPEYDWINVYGGDNALLSSNYRVTSLPAYYLLNPENKFYQSPALAPTPNGTFKSIDEVFYEISMRLHPNNRHHTPGQKDD